jgi:hypothetical protein
MGFPECGGHKTYDKVELFRADDGSGCHTEKLLHRRRKSDALSEMTQCDARAKTQRSLWESDDTDGQDIIRIDLSTSKAKQARDVTAYPYALLRDR